MKRLTIWRGIQKMAVGGNYYNAFRRARELNGSWDTCLVGEHKNKNGYKQPRYREAYEVFSDLLKSSVRQILDKEFYPSLSKEDPKLLLKAIQHIEKIRNVFKR